MQARLRWALGFSFAASVAVATACGGDDSSGDDNGAKPDASSGGGDASTPIDANANASDSAAALDGATANVCLGSSCAGQLLISDPSQKKIYLTDTSGNVTKTITAPFNDVSGVAFDLRDPSGIWVTRTNPATPNFIRLDLDGNVTATHDWQVGASDGGMLDLRFREGDGGGNNDFLVFNGVYNGLIVTSTQMLGDAGGAGSSLDPYVEHPKGPGQVVWGLDVEGDIHVGDFGGNPTRWVTHDIEQDASTLESWAVNVSDPHLTTTQLPTTHALGVALTPEHEFYIVDAEHTRILHIENATGTVLNTVPAPCPNPTGIAYHE